MRLKRIGLWIAMTFFCLAYRNICLRPAFFIEYPANHLESQVDLNESYTRKIAARYEARFKRMYKDCPTTEPRSDYFIPHLNVLTNLNHGLEVCVTGKSGSSTWHMLIWQLSQSDRGQPYDPGTYSHIDRIYGHARGYFFVGSKFLGTWRHGIDDDFFTEPNPQKVFRVIVGRHPFARVISAWHQKTRISLGVYKDFLPLNPDMVKYNKVPADEEHAMSWEDFARYVSEHRIKNYRRDYHFMTHAETCPHCRYFFTYVVKLETLSEDYDWLMKRLKLTGNIKLGDAERSSKINDNPSLNIQKYMKRLEPEVVQNLYNLYEEDFINFGYTYNFKTSLPGGFD